MSDKRPFFGRPEHRCQAPGTVKIQTGNRLMSYEEIDVRIFILCFLIG